MIFRKEKVKDSPTLPNHFFADIWFLDKCKQIAHQKNTIFEGHKNEMTVTTFRVP